MDSFVLDHEAGRKVFHYIFEQNYSKRQLTVPLVLFYWTNPSHILVWYLFLQRSWYQQMKQFVLLRRSDYSDDGGNDRCSVLVAWNFSAIQMGQIRYQTSCMFCLILFGHMQKWCNWILKPHFICMALRNWKLLVVRNLGQKHDRIWMSHDESYHAAELFWASHPSKRQKQQEDGLYLDSIMVLLWLPLSTFMALEWLQVLSSQSSSTRAFYFPNWFQVLLSTSFKLHCWYFCLFMNFLVASNLYLASPTFAI